MGNAGGRALTDDFGLEEHFAGEGPDAAGDGTEMPAEVCAGGEDGAEDGAEAEKEEGDGDGREQQQEEDFERGEVAWLRKSRTVHKLWVKRELPALILKH